MSVIFKSVLALAMGLWILPFKNPAAPVKVRLISDRESIKKDEKFSVGILFEIEPEWHIYAKDPSGGGAPTKVNFIVPKEIQLGELIWPEPIDFPQSGGDPVKGYEGNVTLVASAMTTDSFVSEKNVTLEAEVKWVSCSATLCIPEKRKLSIQLGLGESKISPDAELFKQK